ncbi:MAG: hypothetical protein GXP53_03840 [Deltaproteobacteria bacterium]|nr:hypothetical protein [Deltaproteobacteria bacterium]
MLRTGSCGKLVSKFCFYFSMSACMALIIGFNGQCRSEEMVDRIVAIVDSDIIRLSDLNQAMEPYALKLKGQGVSFSDEEKKLFEARKKVLNDLIDERLADQEIKKEGIRVNDEEIDAAIEQIKAMNYYTDETLRQNLAGEGLDMAAYRREIKKQLLRNRLVAVKVKSKIIITDSDVENYYDNHPERYGGVTKYRLRNIFMAVPQDPAEEKDARARLELVLRQLDKGALFDEMAKKFSMAANANDGGELGIFSLSDLSKKVQTVVRDLKKGEFSDIVKANDGLQIFFVQDITTTKKQKLKDVEDEIKKRLYDQAVNEKFKKWLKTMRDSAHIRIIL